MTTLLALLISIAAAILPTALYAAAFYWADRHEREPKWLVSVAFLWGAIPAIIVSLVAEIAFGAAFISQPGTLGAAVVESAVAAPIIEELAKGFAIWLIYLFFRREFDGVLDGLIYGALVGFGFAMTENFFYFIGAFDEGGFASLSVVIVLRAVIFGLNHALYTGLTGLGFGLARESKSPRARRLWPLFGLALATLVHSLHNLGASLTEVNGLAILLSLGLAVLGFGLILVTYLLSLRREKHLIRRELADEVGILLTERDYSILSGQVPGRRRSAYTGEQKQLINLYAKLAFSKHRLRAYGPDGHPKTLAEIDLLRVRIQEVTTSVTATGTTTSTPQG